LGPSLCSGILGALAFNFFLTEPRYSLAVDDPASIWAIGLLFVVGLIVSGVAFTSHRRATEAALLERQVSALQRYTGELVSADSTRAMVSLTSQALSALFKVPSVAMLVSDGKVVSRLFFRSFWLVPKVRAVVFSSNSSCSGMAKLRANARCGLPIECCGAW
jgi:K+-sensing histidine kinase KdpD